jgi:hypothetical protein
MPTIVGFTQLTPLITQRHWIEVLWMVETILLEAGFVMYIQHSVLSFKKPKTVVTSVSVKWLSLGTFVLTELSAMLGIMMEWDV